MTKIYVASSWRNEHQPSVVKALKTAGHEVYDFRNPYYVAPFKWSDINITEETDITTQRAALLTHPRAAQGFMSDFRAMQWADVCVLVLPAGRSAHLELGWMAGRGKRTFILTRAGEEPDLMQLLADSIVITLHELVRELI